jgi:hypothetical protein
MDIVEATSNADAYHFGNNEYQPPHNWMYQSQSNYIISGVTNIAYLIGMMFAGWRKKHILYFTLFAIYLLFIIYSRMMLD